jgi:SOS-response transcriptional repressor LexA
MPLGRPVRRDQELLNGRIFIALSDDCKCVMKRVTEKKATMRK